MSLNLNYEPILGEPRVIKSDGQPFTEEQKKEYAAMTFTSSVTMAVDVMKVLDVCYQKKAFTIDEAGLVSRMHSVFKAIASSAAQHIEKKEQDEKAKTLESIPEEEKDTKEVKEE